MVAADSWVYSSIMLGLLIHVSTGVPVDPEPEKFPKNTLLPKKTYCAFNTNHIGCKFQQGQDSTSEGDDIVVNDNGQAPEGKTGHQVVSKPNPEKALNSSKQSLSKSKGGQGQSACGRVLARGLSDNDKKIILDAHNLKRTEVASGIVYENLPPAADMAKMVWDPQAAGLAQLFADQYTNQSPRGIETLLPSGETIRNFQLKYVSSPEHAPKDHENSILHASPTMDFNTAVDYWFSEIEKFVLDDIQRYVPDLRTYHFTQLIWAKTFALGCGYLKCESCFKHEDLDPRFTADGANVTAMLADEECWINEELVCHYAPGGNMAGNTIYNAGKACSACPAHLPHCKNMLCSSSK